MKNTLSRRALLNLAGYSGLAAQLPFSHFLKQDKTMLKRRILSSADEMLPVAVMIKKQHLLILLALAVSHFAIAQNFEWAKGVGSNDVYGEVGNSITVDHNGNIYTTGHFGSGVDFDPGDGYTTLPNSGYQDIFIHKLDASGNFVWAKKMGGMDFDDGVSIAVDNNGNIYTTGYFRETVDFDPGPGTANLVSPAGFTDGFIQKLDSSGNFVWVKQIGGAGSDWGNSITVDSFGNVYTTGSFSETTDFDPGPGVANLVAVGASDIFIQKLNASGDFVFVKQIAGTGQKSATSIAVDPVGNIYTAGIFQDTTDFDPAPGTGNLISAGDFDIFVQKLDASGNFIWAKRMGGPGSDWGKSIAVDPDGNVYTTGHFNETADFDPGAGIANLTSAGGFGDIFIQKLDASGGFIWAKQMGGTGNDYGNSLAIDQSGNIYTTGRFNGIADFDPGSGVVNLVSPGGNAAFIQQLDSSGNFIWAIQTGGDIEVIGNSISVDPDRNVYTTGHFVGTADFDPGPDSAVLNSAGGHDMYILKLSRSWNFHGIVFNDLNFNQLQDPNEPGMPGVVIEAGNTGLYATTDSSGHYLIPYNILGDTLNVVSPRPYWSVGPLFAIPDTAQQAMNFAVEIPPGLLDIGVTAIELTPFRNGFDTEIVLQVNNYGFEPVDSVFVSMDISDQTTALQFLSAEPAPVAVSGDSLVWLLDSIGLSGTAVIRVHVKTLAATGHTMSLQARAMFENDDFPVNNSFTRRVTVVGSFDPNDKQVTPESLPVAKLDSTDVHYVIRFQNTGNHPADFVVIRDTLPTGLDIAGIQVLGASHPFTWRLYGERVLEVRFDAINLPDSLSDEPGSHGFVAFAIRLRQDLTTGDSVSNRAAIYFDYNLPVITNPAVISVTDESSVETASKKEWIDIGLSPNPVSEYSIATLDLPLHHELTAAEITICDIHGRLIQRISSNPDKRRIYLNGLPSGVYLIQVRMGKQYGGKLLVVE